MLTLLDSHSLYGTQTKFPSTLRIKDAKERARNGTYSLTGMES